MMRRKKSLSLALCMLLFTSPASAGWWDNFVQMFQDSYQENKKSYSVELVGAGSALGWALYRSLAVAAGLSTDAPMFIQDPATVSEIAVDKLCLATKQYTDVAQSNIHILDDKSHEKLKSVLTEMANIRKEVEKAVAQLYPITSLTLQEFGRIRSAGIALYKYCYSTTRWHRNYDLTNLVFAYLSHFLSQHYNTMSESDKQIAWSNIQQSSQLGKQLPLYERLYHEYKEWLAKSEPSSLAEEECSYIDEMVNTFKNATDTVLAKSSSGTLFISLGQSLAYQTLITQILYKDQPEKVKRYKIVPYSKTKAVPDITHPEDVEWFLDGIGFAYAQANSSTTLENKLFAEILYPQQIGDTEQQLVLIDQIEAADGLKTFLSFLTSIPLQNPQFLLQIQDESLYRSKKELEMAQAFLGQHKEAVTIFNTIPMTVYTDPILRTIHNKMLGHGNETYRMVPPMGPGHWLFGISVPFEPSQNAKNLLFSFLRWKGVK